MSINTIGDYMREETLRVDLRFRKNKDDRDTELENLRDVMDTKLKSLRDEMGMRMCKQSNEPETYSWSPCMFLFKFPPGMEIV